MPQCCVVPHCSKKVSGHRFPDDPYLRKEWLIAIKRDKFVPTKNSRVCKTHFAESDYELPKFSIIDNPKPRLKKGAKSSIFARSTGESQLAISRSERVKNRHCKKEGIEGIPEKVGRFDSDLCSDSLFCEDSTNQEEDCEIIKFQVSEDDNIQCNEVVRTVHDEEEKNDIYEGEGIRTDVNEDLETVYRSESGDETVASDKPSCSHSMRIADYRHMEKKLELKFYTRFENYEHFMFVSKLLGPAVNHLNYYSEYSTHGERGIKNLSPEDQFFLTMVKLRRNMLNKELFRFNVSQVIVTRVFITWLNFLYCQFKELDIWAPHETPSNVMKLKGKDCHATVIIDCTEIRIVQPKNPVSQQQTYSTYKGCNTVKILIGISLTGAVTFCSEAYGGSINDRQLFQRSDILDKLQPNDIIMADRGHETRAQVRTKLRHLPQYATKFHFNRNVYHFLFIYVLVLKE